MADGAGSSQRGTFEVAIDRQARDVHLGTGQHDLVHRTGLDDLRGHALRERPREGLVEALPRGAGHARDPPPVSEQVGDDRHLMAGRPLEADHRGTLAGIAFERERGLVEVGVDRLLDAQQLARRKLVEEAAQGGHARAPEATGTVRRAPG